MTRSRLKKKQYELKRGRGIPTTMPVELVRKRIDELHDLGLTNLMIAYAAGLGKATVSHIENRSTQYTLVDVGARIFTVTHHPHPNQPTVLAIGARRRVRALNALGWPTDELAHRLGQSSRSILNIAISSDYTTYNMWSRIRDLYNELSGTPGPSQHSVRRAHRQGEVPPLAWDGRDIDHPLAQPDWAAAGIKLTQRPVCAKNHRYTPANTYIDTRGHRQCVTCRRAAHARERAQRRVA
ncbi:hypothetical protein [Nocardia niwae]|uniref:hypothetical protein n=1 Tax=Nocardia niwae TaxID=626084 RepID=UPI0007A5021E|nr:hypothetical protein [Nocardia niwae]